MPGDLVLMCTDGLSNMVEEESMTEILSQNMSLKEKAKKLLEQANENGGYDNIAVIVAEPLVSEVGPC